MRFLINRACVFCCVICIIKDVYMCSLCASWLVASTMLYLLVWGQAFEHLLMIPHTAIYIHNHFFIRSFLYMVYTFLDSALGCLEIHVYVLLAPSNAFLHPHPWVPQYKFSQMVVLPISPNPYFLTRPMLSSYGLCTLDVCTSMSLSLIHIWRCRRRG